MRPRPARPRAPSIPLVTPVVSAVALLVLLAFPCAARAGIRGGPDATIHNRLAATDSHSPHVIDLAGVPVRKVRLPGAYTTHEGCKLGQHGAPFAVVDEYADGGVIYFDDNDTYWTYLELRPDSCAGCNSGAAGTISVAHLALYFPFAPETVSVDVRAVASVPIRCHFPNYADADAVICPTFRVTLTCPEPLAIVDFAIPVPPGCELPVQSQPGGQVYGASFLGFEFVSASDTTTPHKPRIVVQEGAHPCCSYNPIGFVLNDLVTSYGIGNPVMYAEVERCDNATHLAIDKRHTAPFGVGRTGAYTLVVRNVGNAATTATTTLSDTLPAGLRFVSGAGSGWSIGHAGQIVTATYPAAIAAGDSAKFTLSVIVEADAAPTVINRATVFTPGASDPPNNFDLDSTAIAPGTAAYSIASVTDVGTDQGHQVQVRWNREPHDAGGSDTTVVSYGIWRRSSANLSARGEQASARANTDLALPPGNWEAVADVPARGDVMYGSTCATLCDSTISQGMCWTAFFVRAQTANPLVFFDTAPDSGYSVDNLPPVRPAAFAGNYFAGATHLQWQPNAEGDFWCYRLHRGSSWNFEPTPGNLLATITGSSYVDAGIAGRYYKLAAVDLNHNMSAFSLLVPSQTLGVAQAGPVELTIESVRPNPSHGGLLQATFTLPSSSPARIELLDVAGRRLLNREVGAFGAGQHVLELRPGRTLAPGLYLVRLTQGAVVRIARTVVLD